MGIFKNLLDVERQKWALLNRLCKHASIPEVVEPTFKTYESKLHVYRIIRQELNDGTLRYLVERKYDNFWSTFTSTKYENIEDCEKDISIKIGYDQLIFNKQVKTTTIL